MQKYIRIAFGLTLCFMSFIANPQANAQTADCVDGHRMSNPHDINGDNKINGFDSFFLRKMIQNPSSYTDYCGDINRDGTIDQNDFSGLKNYTSLNRYRWIIGNWGPCQNGVRTRSLECRSLGGHLLPQSVCERYVGGVPPIQQDCVMQHCRDSDANATYPDGKNYYQRGIIRDGDFVKQDFCANDGSEIIEYFCLEGLGAKKIKRPCEYGCVDGACVQRPVQPCPSTLPEGHCCDGVRGVHLCEEPPRPCPVMFDGGIRRVNDWCHGTGCGDGMLEIWRGEQCDDGNNVNGDGCSATCRNEIPRPCPVMFDGGIRRVNDWCHGTGCGDGMLEIWRGEQCDDGNNVNGDGCSAACRNEIPRPCPVVFDEGIRRVDDWCHNPRCGNGVLDVRLGEQCDDGNLQNGDGCSAICRIEPRVPRCGNGRVELGEQCDDGNNVNGDGCSAFCRIEIPVSRCGDGVIDVRLGEQCDDGNRVNGDGCSAQCRIERPVVCPAILPIGFCCDGVKGVHRCIDPCPVMFDEGIRRVDDWCHNPWCGNGRREVGEQCDDGNRVNGDGCSAACRIETSLPQCGNGRVEVGEQCDDGDTPGGCYQNDGCNDCKVTPIIDCLPGYELTCDGKCEKKPYVCPSVLPVGQCCNDKRGVYKCDDAPVCGNGEKEAVNCSDPDVKHPICDEVQCVTSPCIIHEQCDDGNVRNGDGCSKACMDEPKPTCKSNKYAVRHPHFKEFLRKLVGRPSWLKVKSSDLSTITYINYVAPEPKALDGIETLCNLKKADILVQ